jgi:HD-GYP domain-containing protein (c-di-GMP phosphodiesterase class II)
MIKHENNIPLYNSRIINTWIEFLKEKYPQLNIREILEYADIQDYEVVDQGHWFTQEQVDKFYEKIQNLTKNPNIAREAGRYLVKPGVIGYLWQFTFGQIGPAKMYELISKASKNYAISSSYFYKKINDNKIEIVSKPNEGVNEKKYQCENRTGIFEAVALGYTHRLPSIDHPECIFNGGNVCRYVIAWKKSYSEIFNRILLFLSLISLAILLFYIIKDIDFAITLLPIFTIVFLALFLIKYLFKNKETNNSLNILRNTADELVEQVNINYNNTVLTNEVGQTISGHTNLNDVLNNIANITEKRLSFDRGIILLPNEDKTRLMFRAGFGYSDNQISSFPKDGFHLDDPGSRGIFVLSFKEQKPFLINDVNEISTTLSSRSLEFAKKLGTKSFICCPIINNNESLGIIAVDNIQSKRPLIQSDLTLMMGIASIVGISIRNAALIESKVRQFNSILFVLAASIDARDFLTAGHSEKVMEFSIGICYELALPEEYTEMIRVAALLHDYGKIGVPDSILKKSGKLTPEEYHEIQTHAAKTQTILERISFEGIYSKIPEIAGCHHEKLDGSGYPKGLRGEEIPLGARIIAVADFFEAITAKRHYREPMQIDEAMELLTKEADIRLDGKIIRAFKRFYSKKYDWTPSGT